MGKKNKKNDTGESTERLLEEILKPDVDPKIKRIYSKIIENRTDIHGSGDTKEAQKRIETEGLHGWKVPRI